MKRLKTIAFIYATLWSLLFGLLIGLMQKYIGQVLGEWRTNARLITTVCLN